MPTSMNQMTVQNEEDFDCLIIAKLRNDTTNTRMVSLRAAAKFLGLTTRVLLHGRTRNLSNFQFEESMRGYLMNVGELVRWKNQLEIVGTVVKKT